MWCYSIAYSISQPETDPLSFSLLISAVPATYAASCIMINSSRKVRLVTILSKHLAISCFSILLLAITVWNTRSLVQYLDPKEEGQVPTALPTNEKNQQLSETFSIMNMTTFWDSPNNDGTSNNLTSTTIQRILVSGRNKTNKRIRGHNSLHQKNYFSPTLVAPPRFRVPKRGQQPLFTTDSIDDMEGSIDRREP